MIALFMSCRDGTNFLQTDLSRRGHGLVATFRKPNRGPRFCRAWWCRRRRRDRCRQPNQLLTASTAATSCCGLATRFCMSAQSRFTWFPARDGQMSAAMTAAWTTAASARSGSSAEAGARLSSIACGSAIVFVSSKRAALQQESKRDGESVVAPRKAARLSHYAPAQRMNVAQLYAASQQQNTAAGAV